MPTAIRLAGLAVFGLFAWFISELMKPVMPPGTNFGAFSLYNGVIGMICGWIIMGPRHGLKVSSAVGIGLTAAAVTVFSCLFFYSVAEMVKQSFRHVYGGPAEAVIGVFQLMIKFGLQALTPGIITAIIVAGVVGGAICGAVSRRWS